MPQITLPDNSVKSFENPVSPFQVAETISKSLAKSTLFAIVDGEEWDAHREVANNANIELVTKDDERSLELIRHDAAHIMAQAVKELYPNVQVTIGPAIKDGFYYDFYREEPFTPEDLPKIEKRMREIVKRNEPIVRHVWDRDEAIKYFKDQGEEFKAELIKDLPENETITVYKQGAFEDLCRGPHLPSTGKLGTAFKLTKISGSYWRGDSEKAQLQRIYGTAWATQEQLDQYLNRLKEAEKRDHRKLGREMDLFHFQPEAPGAVFWHHKGWLIYKTLLDYMRGKVEKYGYTEVNTPQMLDRRFWEYSGHWDKYRENMFVIEEEEDVTTYALKPMNCPGGVQIYKAKQHSYRELPIRMAEFGQVFRREASGARHGLLRVQTFNQDDAHIFCTSEQLEDEVVDMCNLIKEVYTDVGISDNITIYLSTRPEKRIGSDEDWDRAETALKKVCERIDMNWQLNEGDGAFYAPKLDFVVEDALGRQWQCGTIQVDMNLPTRLDITYIAEDGQKKRPHLIHRAIMGSMERFMGMLLEHHAGNLPLWLAPVQVVVATITNSVDDYAHKTYQQLKEAGLRVELDIRSEKIGYKVREHSNAKVPYIFAIGAQEAEGNTVAVRRLGTQGQKVESFDEMLKDLQIEATVPIN